NNTISSDQGPGNNPLTIGARATLSGFPHKIQVPAVKGAGWCVLGDPSHAAAASCQLFNNFLLKQRVSCNRSATVNNAIEGLYRWRITNHVFANILEAACSEEHHQFTTLVQRG